MATDDRALFDIQQELHLIQDEVANTVKPKYRGNNINVKLDAAIESIMQLRIAGRMRRRDGN